MRPTVLRTALLVSTALVLATALAPTVSADVGGVGGCAEEDDPDEAEQCACEKAFWSFNELTPYRMRCVEDPDTTAALAAVEAR